MKRILFIIVLLISSWNINAQNVLSNSVKETITIGNINSLSSHFTENIDISINDTDAIYSKSQAAMILKKFFKNNKVIAFKMEHEGSSSGSNQYSIAKMKCQNGTYRVTYFISGSGKDAKIKQFNIEGY